MKNLYSEIVMKRILNLALVLAILLLSAVPASAIDKQKKDSSARSNEEKEEKLEPVVTQKKPTANPVEIAPPQTTVNPPPQRQPEVRPDPPARERVKEEPQMLKPKTDDVDRFVDKNKNGIDDRLEARKTRPKKPEKSSSDPEV